MLEGTLCTAGLHRNNASALAAITTSLSLRLRVPISRKAVLHLVGMGFLVNTFAQGIAPVHNVVAIISTLMQSARHSIDDPNGK